MKTNIFFLLALALTIASCGGGNSTTTSTQTAPPLYDILAQISKLHDGIFDCDKIHDSAGTASHLSFCLNPGDDMATFHDLDCFAIKGGGFLVNFYSYGDPIEPVSELYTYQDGTLSKTDISKYLPALSIGDFYTNAGQFPKPAYDKLTDIIASHLQYIVSDGHLMVQMNPWEESGEGFVMPAVLNGLTQKTGGEPFPEIIFNWDGERFTRDPASKPVEEDLKYFQTADNAHIAQEIWNAILTQYDPVEKVKNPGADAIAANRQRIRENSPTNAEFVYSGGGINFYQTLACYKQTNGHWLAIVLNGSGAMNDLTVYDYDGTSVNERKKFFNQDFLRRYNISEMSPDGLITYDDTDGNSGEIYFRWDGEKFVK
jgi:hypothetical protein